MWEICKKTMNTGDCGEQERAEIYPAAVRTRKLRKVPKQLQNRGSLGTRRSKRSKRRRRLMGC